MRHVQRVIDRVAVVQIDSVNVAVAQPVPPVLLPARPLRTALVDRARDRAPRRLVEYWAHMASLVPPTTWPLLDFRMRAAPRRRGAGCGASPRSVPALVDAVLAEVGPGGR